jgi:hypothetical protein
VRLRLLLPGRRGGAGLGGLRPHARQRLRRRGRRSRPPAASLRRHPCRPAVLACALAAAAALAIGCGGGASQHRTSSSTTPPPPAASGPAFGITEDNADLLWAPGADAPAQAAPFLAARRELSALHPRYYRLLIDWASLQPSPDGPASLTATVDGCARGEPPCGSYPGVTGELEAIASQQRAARSRGEAVPQVVIDILGAPPWAVLPAHGCEAPATPATARTLRPDALPAYRALIASLLALGRREGVALPWWTPWNEPNDPRFLGPQRASCSPSGAPLATGAYAELARAMATELKAGGGGGQMLLGELGGYLTGSPHRLAVDEFVAALPGDVLCLARDWSVHAYASYGANRGPEGESAVAALERALDARGGCARSARVWVTEAGAGAPRPGRARASGPAQEDGAYTALSAQLGRWSADPRVAAVFQYSFRDDPAYPVGLVDPSLERTYRTYSLWMGFTRR